MQTKESVIQLLETIIDPELNIDIYTLGLIYDIDIQDDTTVHITMTYTTPMCPAGPYLQDQIRNEMINLGFEHIAIEVTFDPPWEMSKELKVMFGL